MSETRATYQAGEPDTIRDLLRRWAELEPKRCRLSESNDNEIDVRINEGDMWCEIALDSIVALDMMWIQWAVQQAIVKQGWRWNLECYPITEICEGVVFFDYDHIRRRGGDPAEALLAAYLAVLETNKKAG
jgi:hypothetical protein